MASLSQCESGLMVTKIIIMGAAGRDFHNFNVAFRDNDKYQVIAFTASQIPNIEGRMYPKELAGKNYPKGIPIYAEDELPRLIKENSVDQVIFGYSDISHETVMHKASIALANGSDFRLMGPKSTMLKSKVPVISVCAVRTGSGKSQTSRKVCEILKNKGKRVVVVRHPMPYGNLKEQVCQRFETYADLEKHKCTIEEREEYEPHIDKGIVVYAGVDYKKILEEAEKEADIIVWDGGNNDLPFFKPDLHIVLVDPHRPDHCLRYHLGESNLRMADVVVINKIDTAKAENVEMVENIIKRVRPDCVVIRASSPVEISEPEKIKGKSALVVEDGPTLTHGEMPYGAGRIAAERAGVREIVDPRDFAVGSIKKVYEDYKHLGNVLPAMGYGRKQIKELEETINACDCDVVIVGTPIDLRKVMNINKPAVRVRYKLKELGRPNLDGVLKDF